MRAATAVGLLLWQAVVLAQQPVREQARAYVQALAAPAMHGRGYVQGGDSLAADWLAERFAQIGLEPLAGERFQPFIFPVNTFPDSVKLILGGERLRPGLDFITDPASGPDSGRFIIRRLGLEDLTDEDQRIRTWQTLEGGIAWLGFPPTTDADSLRLYADLLRETVRHVPVLRPGGPKLTWSVAGEAFPHAVLELREGTLPDTATVAFLRVRNRFNPAHGARNVFGVVRAKRTDAPWVLVTAHYDHLGQMGPDALFPGANDNASGTAMLLCLAQWFRQKPARSNLLFIGFAGEEAGLLGSQWFTEHPPLDLGRVRAVVNLDLNGTGEEGITVVNATEQKVLYDQLVKINKRSSHLPQVKARGPACNSDHCPFARMGVPAIFIYTMGGVSYYHDVQDRAETLPLTRFDGLYRTLIPFLRNLK
jgi:aminopeptidase YwaD